MVDCLYELVLKQSFDLVSFTAHGHGPHSSHWLGSIADQLVHRLPCSMIVVRPLENERPDVAIRHSYKRLLLTLDGTAVSEAAIPPCAIFAEQMKAEIHMIRVLEPATDWDWSNLGTPTAQTDFTAIEYAREDGNRYLQQQSRSFLDKKIHVQKHLAVHPFPPLAILNEAKNHHCDLIVMGTSSKLGYPRTYLGAVADKVLRGANVSVLIHRPILKA